MNHVQDLVASKQQSSSLRVACLPGVWPVYNQHVLDWTSGPG
jgi:hypothetical protein